MPLRRRSSPRQHPAPYHVGLSSRLPTPFMIARPMGNSWRVETFRGAVLTSVTTYGTLAKTLSRVGEGLAYGSAGSLFTFDAAGANWARSSWCFAGQFITTTTASIQTLASINGDINGLQLRINTSGQFEILSEGAALLDTSSLTVSANTPYTYSVCSSALLSSTEVWVNGQRWINYAGTIDIKDPATAMRIYVGRRLTAADNFLVGSAFDALGFWAHGAGFIPTPQQQQWMTSAPGLRAALFCQRTRPQRLAAAAAGITGPLVMGGHLINQGPLVGGRLALS